jgi:hypothetical protein
MKNKFDIMAPPYLAAAVVIALLVALMCFYYPTTFGIKFDVKNKNGMPTMKFLGYCFLIPLVILIAVLMGYQYYENNK